MVREAIRFKDWGQSFFRLLRNASSELHVARADAADIALFADNGDRRDQSYGNDYGKDHVNCKHFITSCLVRRMGDFSAIDDGFIALQLKPA
ncbi:hypothetical protein ABID16_000967 [Rhizobium aquaticum]|uniref:Amidase domain-containing protein n=1 Tax=Rhizobium aquaticum TaxID=1549636 RepID=A0ABV2IW04_9HYPH